MNQANWTVELLPIFIERGGNIRWLARTDNVGSWRVDSRPDISPHDLVLDALCVFGVGPFVAHSTSWRFESSLILTYLILLPTLHAAPPAGFEVHRVQRESLARGDLAAPPPSIAVDQVLEHALRHLAWLAGDDPAIRALLGPSWIEALSMYRPEPFRSIQETFAIV
ncbi:MAG TPA: hypothetical protein VFB50_21605 [Chloroflexota bacterium]|nr:hypothetical protein [Chloroflexota bacterium]